MFSLSLRTPTPKGKPWLRKRKAFSNGKGKKLANAYDGPADYGLTLLRLPFLPLPILPFLSSSHPTSAGRCIKRLFSHLRRESCLDYDICLNVQTLPKALLGYYTHTHVATLNGKQTFPLSCTLDRPETTTKDAKSH